MFNRKKNTENFVKTTQYAFEKYAEAIESLAQSIAVLNKEIEEQKATIQVLSANNNVFIEEIKLLYAILNNVKVDQNIIITLQ